MLSQTNFSDAKLEHYRNLILSKQYEDLLEIKNKHAIIYTKKDLMPLFDAIQTHTAESGLFRLVVIHDAQKLDTKTSNELLKVLEEPPLNTYFVLLTNDHFKLLDTIKSRCFLFQLKTKIPKFSKKNPTLEQALIFHNYSADEIERLKDDQFYQQQFSDAHRFSVNQKQTDFAIFNIEFEKTFLAYNMQQIH